MGIKSVNGTNVYVLDPPKPGTKTTTGKNWASLYTDLRWKVWEDVQKSEMAKLKLDQMDIKARTDIYEQATRDIRRSITQLQKLKAEALAGGSTARQVASRAAKQATLDAAQQKFNIQQRTKALPKQREVTKEVTTDMFGRPLKTPTTETTTTTTRLKGAPPLMQRTVIGTDGVPVSAEGEAAAPAGVDFLDAEIDKLERQLAEEAEDYRRSVGSTGGLDVLGQTRGAFEEKVGVIGQGGGMFGLAPRRRRTAPRVDEPLAQERVGDFAEAAVQDKAQREALQEKRMALLLRREEAMAMGGDDAGALAMSINEELGAIDSALAQPSLVESALQSPEFTPRRAGELLLRDRGTGMPTEAPVSPVEPPESIQGVSTPEPIVEPVEAPIEPPIEPVPAFDPIEPAPPVVEPAPAPPVDDIVFQTGKVDMPAGESDLGGNFVYDSTTNTIFNPAGFPIYALSPSGKNPDGSQVEVVTEPVLRQKALEIRKRERSDVVLPPRGEQPDAPQASTTKQRKDLYKFRVVTEGTRLAKTPKKLDRLAKTHADDSDRKPHFVIVDKLMATNSGKADAFKMSYDEISRAFGKNPEQRKEAHEYLVARNILESDITEPLA